MTVVWPLLGLAIAFNATACLRRWTRRTDGARRRAEFLLGSLPLAVVALDGNGRVAAGNAPAEGLLGRRLERGQAWPGTGVTFFSADGEGVGFDPVGSALSSGSPCRVAARLQRPSGESVEVLVRAEPLQGPAGAPAVVAVLEPLAAGRGGDRSRAGDESGPARSPSTDLIAELFDALPDPTLVLNGSGQVTGINQAALRLFGFATADEAFRPAADYPALCRLRHAGGLPLAGHEWLPVRLLTAAEANPGDAEAYHQDVEMSAPHLTSGAVALSCRAALHTLRETGERAVLWVGRVAPRDS